MKLIQRVSANHLPTALYTPETELTDLQNFGISLFDFEQAPDEFYYHEVVVDKIILTTSISLKTSPTYTEVCPIAYQFEITPEPYDSVTKPSENFGDTVITEPVRWPEKHVTGCNRRIINSFFGKEAQAIFNEIDHHGSSFKIAASVLSVAGCTVTEHLTLVISGFNSDHRLIEILKELKKPYTFLTGDAVEQIASKPNLCLTHQDVDCVLVTCSHRAVYRPDDVFTIAATDSVPVNHKYPLSDQPAFEVEVTGWTLHNVFHFALLKRTIAYNYWKAENLNPNMLAIVYRNGAIDKRA